MFKIGKTNKTYISVYGGRGQEFDGFGRFFLAFEIKLPRFLYRLLPQRRTSDISVD